MNYEKIAHFLARLLIGVLFSYAGIINIIQFQTILQVWHQKALPFAIILLIIVIAVQILAGVALILGFKTKHAATLLLLLLIATAAGFVFYWHPNWNTALHSDQFPQNVGFFAALLLLSARG